MQEDTGLPASVDTLAERFRRAGWSTWGFVTNVQVIPRELGFDQGFDSFRVFPGEDGGVLARTSEVDPFLFAQLQKGLAEDFLLYVHTVDPHAPYDPPDGYAGLFSDPDYAGSVGPFDTLAVELRSRDVSTRTPWSSSCRITARSSWSTANGSTASVSSRTWSGSR